MKHAIGAFIFVVILTVAGILVLTTDRLLPVEASVQAGPIDGLFNLHFKIIAFLFALIVGIMLYSIIFFRRKPGETGDGAYIKGSKTLELIWTAIPLATVIGVSFLGSEVLARTQSMDPQALDVTVTGQQWSWSFEYPKLGIVSDELVLPVDKQVLLSLTSVDVIHSFWVPEFRVKQDALPGMVRELRVTPDLLGNYSLLCSEMCGKQHAYMTAPVRVVSEADFQAWVNANNAATSDDPAVRGSVWFKQFGCASCHTVDGTKLVGPTFQGLWGSTVTFEDGSTAVVDEAYIYESITDPAAHIVQGYPNAMPADFLDRLSQEQITDLTDFIKSLK